MGKIDGGADPGRRPVLGPVWLPSFTRPRRREQRRLRPPSPRAVPPRYDQPCHASAKALLGGPFALVAPIAIVLGVFAVGFYVFNRTAPYGAENL
jgi:hypothetical protein